LGLQPQAGRDGAYLSRKLLEVVYDCSDVVTCGECLLEDLPTDAAGRRENCELHLKLPAFLVPGVLHGVVTLLT